MMKYLSPMFPALIFTAALQVAAIVFPMPASAVVTDFKAGRIIEDSVFTNATSMSAANVQTFLETKVPVCDTTGQKLSELGGPDLNGDGKVQRWEYGQAVLGQTTFICLKDYRVSDGRLAAQVIYDTALKYRINPQVFVILLQKEMALVTDDWPSNQQYERATGYGCPDNTGGVCDAEYYGFVNQVDWSGKMFRAILDDSPTWYTPYILGNNYVQYNPVTTCGGTTVNIENRSTQALYNYTPYQPNAAALAADYGIGDSCSAYGNRNFFLYFRDWFGFSSGPVAFKTADNPTIYASINGYKLTVPYMAVLQDYGVSVDTIQTVTQAYVDSIPSPTLDSGISSQIGHVVKSPNDADEDGGSVYLISLNTRYQFQSLQQLAQFGFTESEIRYLPLQYILGKPNGGMLPNFATSPTNSVFGVDSGGKHLIFDYATYINLNPTDKVARLSYYLVDKIASGNPWANKPILVKPSVGDAVFSYDAGTYRAIPTYETYSCWGFDTLLKTPVFRIPQANYALPISSSSSLSCAVQMPSTGETRILNGKQQLPYTNLSGITPTVLPASLETLLQPMPRATSIQPYIKVPGQSAVWLLENGSRRLIPTYATYVALRITDASTSLIPYGVTSNITQGLIKLADGQVVKDDASGAVYLISNNTRYLYSYADLFVAYGNSWSSIATVPQTPLNAAYPVGSKPISDVYVDTQAKQSYLVASNGCFSFTSSLYQALGTTYDTLAAAQPYSYQSFKALSLTKCQPATLFVRSYSNSLVYKIEAGKRIPLSTYSALLSANGGTEPVVMKLSPAFINSIPLS